MPLPPSGPGGVHSVCAGAAEDALSDLEKGLSRADRPSCHAGMPALLKDETNHDPRCAPAGLVPSSCAIWWRLVPLILAVATLSVQETYGLVDQTREQVHLGRPFVCQPGLSHRLTAGPSHCYYPLGRLFRFLVRLGPGVIAGCADEAVWDGAALE